MITCPMCPAKPFGRALENSGHSLDMINNPDFTPVAAEAEWKEADSGRERKYYSLSSEGKKTLATEREQWLKVHNTLCKLWKIKPALT